MADLDPIVVHLDVDLEQFKARFDEARRLLEEFGAQMEATTDQFERLCNAVQRAGKDRR